MLSRKSVGLNYFIIILLLTISDKKILLTFEIKHPTLFDDNCIFFLITKYLVQLFTKAFSFNIIKLLFLYNYFYIYFVYEYHLKSRISLLAITVWSRSQWIDFWDRFTLGLSFEFLCFFGTFYSYFYNKILYFLVSWSFSLT